MEKEEFQNLFRVGDEWTWTSLQKIAEEVLDPAFKGDRKMGVRGNALWPFIPIGKKHPIYYLF